ncbi:SDR family oxidoreductase [Streptomyces sp. NPDC048581]|uniref:SDR family oxidoreductase n=1 Tax=unclassified Streptomyces TaxID=2593676 RepID=UPI003713409C
MERGCRVARGQLSLADELGPDGIVVNAVAPGWVDTPGTRAGGRMAQAVQAVPLGRAAQPEEIADRVWKLCHGSYVTGETLVVSGGLTVRLSVGHVIVVAP